MSIPHTYLRAFHAVAIHGSFTRAAESLHVTQPTLSGQVKALEQLYQVKLFTRFGRKVELTTFGQRALQVTQNLFHYEQAAEQLFRSATALTTGHLIVGADSPYIITPCLAAFQRRYPGVEISIRYGNTREIHKWIQSSKCDIAIVPNAPTDDSSISILPLKPDKLVAFVNRNHVWAQRNTVTLQDLADQRVVLREPGSETRFILEEAFASSGIELVDTVEVGSREGVREAVATGMGVGVIAEAELGQDNRFQALIVSDALLTHSEYIICLSNRREEKILGAFLGLAKETLADI